MKRTRGRKQRFWLWAWVGRHRSRGRSQGSRRSANGQTVDWRLVVRRRLTVAAVGLAFWAGGIEARLVYLQILQHDELVARADRQQNRSIDANPKRGEILDRHGRVLAYSVDADTIYAVPSEINTPAETAERLCEAFDKCDEGQLEIMKKRLRQANSFAYIRRQASPDEARRVAALSLEGVGFHKENRRYYPNKELAAHLLGFVGIDNQGLSGIEWTYDSEIGGRAGKILIQTDARRRAFSRIERPPTAGATLELTIDKYIQHIVERELRNGLREHSADGGSVVVLDPYTGEVLALANEPTFNPNAFAEATAEARRNRVIQDIYEPGSTFKLVTASAAFEEKAVEQDEIFDVSDGFIRVGLDRIPDFRVYDQLSFTDVIVKSSNVGTIQIGLRLGPERLIRYVRRFGFGQRLSPDFPGESPGIVWNPADLDDRALASVSMGYQVAVTPLQMATAASVVANGGVLLMPRAVRAVRRNGMRTVVPRRVIRRAITAQTSAELTTIMEAVVERGTGRAARIPGYTVAGKTGTSEKLIDGRYSDTDHNASFVGFVPSRQPVLTILVMIDTPRGTRMSDGRLVRKYTGGAVAAPIFRRIAEAALRHLAVPPTINPQPPVLVTRERTAPVAQTSTGARAQAVVTPAVDTTSPSGLMPDLTGMSAREALQVLGRLGMGARLAGSGFVTMHEPGPGSAVERGSTALVWLERLTAPDRNVNP